MHSPIGSLNRIIIYAGNAIRCATFFRDHFGFTPLGQWDADWAELDAGGCRLAFHQAYGSKGPVRKPTGSPGNPHKIVIVVPDVEAARQRLMDQGVEVGPIQSFPELDGLVFCQGLDPEGHVYQLANR